jgi:DNA topoisomerase-1
MTLERITVDDAEQLLQLPRSLGTDPADDQEILANNGRYGPYVKHGAVNANIPGGEDPETLTLETATALLAARAAKAPTKGGKAKSARATASAKPKAAPKAKPASTEEA